MKQALKRLLGSYYTPRLRHLKRRLEVRFLGKGEPELALLPKLLDRNLLSLDIGANVWFIPGEQFGALPGLGAAS